MRIRSRANQRLDTWPSLGAVGSRRKPRHVEDSLRWSSARVTAVGSVLALPTAVLALASSVAVAAAQDADETVPPGDPVVRSNGALTTAAAGDPNYELWALVAVCLIAAGVLLITIERWEARRIRHAET